MRLLGLGASLPIAFAAACAAQRPSGIPEPSEPRAPIAQGYEFSGRLVVAAPNGELVGVVPDAVLVGWGTCQRSLQKPATLKVAPDGAFKVSVNPQIFTVRETTLKPDGSANRPMCEVGVNWPCYRFQANGCADATLQFTSAPPGNLVTLDCPQRIQQSEP